jgi:hypothetical protein
VNVHNPQMAPGAPPKKKSKALLFVGIGCVSVIALCCLSGGGVAYYMKSSKEGDGRAQAEYFLSNMQARNYPGAFGAAEGMMGSGLYTVDQFMQCLSETPLATVASYDCSQGADAELMGNRVMVYCNVLTAAGPQDVAIGVNVYDFDKSLGFIWFRPGAPLGPSWRAETCAAWSGKMSIDEPPDGFARP